MSGIGPERSSGQGRRAMCKKNTALEISAVLQICSPERNRTFIVRTGILYSIH